MSRIDDLIRDLCPDGVEYKPLGDVARYSPRKVSAENLNSTTFVGVDNLVSQKRGRIDATHAPNTSTLTAYYPGNILLGNIRPYLKKVWLADRSGGCSGDVLAIDINDQHSKLLEPQFLYYILSSDPFFTFNQQNAKGAKMPRGNKAAILRYPVPVPPLKIQHDIIETLSQFTQLEAELEAELEARKQQYSHYLNQLLNPNTSTHRGTLKEIGPVRMCKRIMKEQTSQQGDIPFYKIKSFGGVADAYISRDLYDRYRENYPFPNPGSILISAAGTIGRAIPYDGRDAYFQDSNIVWIENNETLVLNRYLFYFYKIVDWKTDGGTIKRLYNERLLNTTIPIPPLSRQRHIVNALDKFDALVNDLTSGLPAEIEARRRQYEYYRDRLLTFPEKK